MISNLIASPIKFITLLALGFLILSTADAKPVNIGPTGILGSAEPKWPHPAVAIRVDSCEKGSPADGQLNAGDLIVGIDGKKFTKSPFAAFPEAVDIAEAKDGKLNLLLEGGKQVTLQLEKMGAYSPTAPYDCAKTNKIIEQAAERLMTEKGFGSSPTRSGLLGLMATGEPEHLAAVRDYIHQSDILKVDTKAIEQYLQTGQPDMGSTGWVWGYNLIALGEYYLLTKDETVLPAIRAYAIGLAGGQDGVGLWGHRMARGELRRAPGYGIMNAASIPNFIGLIIAQKCDINNPVVDAAIEKTYAYVADHIGNGGFPYGVHGHKPEIYNNNGSSGSAAVSMALIGNLEGAKYFSRSCAPTHDTLTVGHASHYFNPLWTPLGVSLSGPEMTQEFFKRSLWYFNGKRHWNGGFPGNEGGGFFAGQALLTYCLPRKVLLITGREADESIWVRDPQMVNELITMDKVDFKSKSLDELLEMFNHPFSQVRVGVIKEVQNRRRASTEKASKSQTVDAITPKLKQLALHGKEQEKLVALDCLGGVTSREIRPDTAKFLGEILNNQDESLQVRVAAASALGRGNCGEEALPYYDDIMRFTLEKRSQPDPFGHVDSKLASALDNMTKRIKEPELEKGITVDRQTRYRVAKQFLDHPRQDVRGFGGKLLKDIPIEDFHIVADELLHVLQNNDPSYHTYSSTLNADGLGVLAELNIKEGLDLLEEGIFHGSGKWGFKYRALMSALPKYGANAKPYIAKFEAHKDINKEGDRFTPQWQKVVEQIMNDTSPRKLITVEEAKQIGLSQQGK